MLRMSQRFVALALALVCALAEGVQVEPRQDRCVILVSVDGLAGFYVDDPKADMQQDPHAPDLWLAAKPGYSFSGSYMEDELLGERKSAGGTCGSLPDQPDLLAACVVWGPGIKPGTQLGKVKMLDVAPSIAGILGIALPSADGMPLQGLQGE